MSAVRSGPKASTRSAGGGVGWGGVGWGGVGAGGVRCCSRARARLHGHARLHPSAPVVPDPKWATSVRVMGAPKACTSSAVKRGPNCGVRKGGGCGGGDGRMARGMGSSAWEVQRGNVSMHDGASWIGARIGETPRVPGRALRPSHSLQLPCSFPFLPAPRARGRLGREWGWVEERGAGRFGFSAPFGCGSALRAGARHAGPDSPKIWTAAT